MRGIAAIADDLAGGYADITTRANLQLREIKAESAPEVLLRLSEIGLTSRGSGADNIRNITGSPTAGIDPQELIDTRPYARALHHFILYHRELYGLPRKFNIAFDGGGAVAVLEDTNDIALSAVQVQDGFGVPPGVYFRLDLGGITGHGDFARATGVIVAPDDAVKLCDAVLRAYIAQGDRTDRTKARLKYVLDRMGVPAFLEEVAQRIRRSRFSRVDQAAISAASAARQARPYRRARAEAARIELYRRALPGRAGFSATGCAAWPTSPTASAPARSASPSGRTCSSATCPTISWMRHAKH